MRCMALRRAATGKTFCLGKPFVWENLLSGKTFDWENLWLGKPSIGQTLS
jgi:hypothetical protein